MAWNAAMPTVEEYAVPLFSILLLYGVFDLVFARHTKSRWFCIHVLANIIVVCETAPAMHALLDCPQAAVMMDTFSPIAMSANLAVHIYHVAMFRDLYWIDWLHHGVMTGIVTPLVMTYDSFLGPILDGANFFLCGFPGGLDYLMLVFVKHGWLSPLREKKYNSFINTWIRSPGILFISSLGFVQAHMKDPTCTYFRFPESAHELAVVFLLIWNSQYFAERVIGNYHVRRYQHELKTAAQGDTHDTAKSNGKANGTSH